MEIEEFLKIISIWKMADKWNSLIHSLQWSNDERRSADVIR